MTTAIEARQGFSLSGQYLSTKPGKPWTGRDGTEHHPVVVTLLTGDRAVRIEYRDASSADMATAGASRGDELSLPVFPKAKGKDWLHVAGLNERSGE